MAPRSIVERLSHRHWGVERTPRLGGDELAGSDARRRSSSDGTHSVLHGNRWSGSTSPTALPARTNTGRAAELSRRCIVPAIRRPAWRARVGVLCRLIVSDAVLIATQISAEGNAGVDSPGADDEVGAHRRTGGVPVEGCDGGQGRAG